MPVAFGSSHTAPYPGASGASARSHADSAGRFRSDLLVVGNDAPRASRSKAKPAKRPEARRASGTAYTGGVRRPQSAGGTGRSRNASPSSRRKSPDASPDPLGSEYLPDVVHVVFADLRESEQPDDLHVAPEIILANLKRLRLRHGIRVTDVQDLTKSQPDGKLTIAEFRLLLHKVGIKAGDEFVQQAFAQLDMDRNHKISWLELWTALAPTPTDVLREVRLVKKKKRLTVSELIRPYDSNSDDVLTAGEFHRLLDGLGFDLDSGVVREIVRQIDLDGDRQVSHTDLQHALDHLGGSHAMSSEVLASAASSIPKPDRRGKGSPGSKRSMSSPELTRMPLRRPSSSPSARASRGSPVSPGQTHLQGTLNELFDDLEPEASPAAGLTALSPNAKRPMVSPEAAMSKLRRLRLTGRISVKDLHAIGDANGNGTLSKAELFKVLLAAGIKADDDLTQKIFDFIDQDGNGKITLTELWNAMQPSVSEVLKVLQAVKERKNLSVETLVRQFDSNGDDRLTFLEFQKMLNALSLDLDESTAREVFRHLDVDGDRQLSLRTLSQLQSGQRTSNETRPSSPSGHSVAEVLKALQAIKEERKLSVETLIRLFDSDGDDKLTYAEFQALLGTLSIDAEESVAREVFAKLDLDGDGQLSLNTLNALQSAQPSQGLPHQTLPGEDSVADVLKVLQTIQERKKVSVEALIQMFDSDSDGKLTFGEFQKMLSALHLNVEEGTAKEAFAKLDLDGDGQLSLKTLRSLQSLQGQAPERLQDGPAAPSSEDVQALEGLSEHITPQELFEMLQKCNVGREEELVGQIFRVLDPAGNGRVGRSDLLQNFHFFFPTYHQQTERPGGPALRPPSPQHLPSLPGPREEPRSASGHPLGAHAWELLHRIYRRLAWQDSTVSTLELIEEIRRDVHVRSERLLDRPVVGIDFGQGPSISLDAALQHVSRQVSQSRDLEVTTWERFNWLLVEAQRFCQGMPSLEERIPSPQRGPPASRWFLSVGASSLVGCPNPEEEPGAAIEWMANENGFDRDLLYRLFDMFRLGAAEVPKRVSRERFLQAVQASPRLQTALLSSPLLTGAVMKPMNWGDFLWYLTQLEAASISWSDVLATACWCRLLSLGLASGDGHPSQISPRLSSAANRARLEMAMRNAGPSSSPVKRSPSSPSRSAATLPSTVLPAMQRAPRLVPRDVQDLHEAACASPLAAVDTSFARVTGAQPRTSKHPWLEDSDDEGGKLRPPQAPFPPFRPPPDGTQSKRLGVRFQAAKSCPAAEREKLEAELARILADLPVQSVKLREMRSQG